MNFEETSKIRIELNKSPSPDGKFLPKGMWIYLDDEHVKFITGFRLDAQVDGDVKLVFEYVETDEDGKPKRTEDGEFVKKTWTHEVLKEDEIEIVEEEELIKDD